MTPMVTGIEIHVYDRLVTFCENLKGFKHKYLTGTLKIQTNGNCLALHRRIY